MISVGAGSKKGHALFGEIAAKALVGLDLLSHALLLLLLSLEAETDVKRLLRGSLGLHLCK